MSNYELQSRLNQLQSELRAAERYNAELRGELSTVEHGVSRAHRDLEDYNDKLRNTLDRCNGTMQSSHQRVIDAHALAPKLPFYYCGIYNKRTANSMLPNSP